MVEVLQIIHKLNPLQLVEAFFECEYEELSVSVMVLSMSVSVTTTLYRAWVWVWRCECECEKVERVWQCRTWGFLVILCFNLKLEPSSLLPTVSNSRVFCVAKGPQLEGISIQCCGSTSASLYIIERSPSSLRWKPFKLRRLKNGARRALAYRIRRTVVPVLWGIGRWTPGR